jgi:NADPH:quinone reductase
MALLAAGRAMPHIGASFPLDETAAALRCVADGQAIGKVVITIA